MRIKTIMKIKGFTLAEVLITLGIIGVVAAITIPTLINNIQDAQFKSALKKEYSVFSGLYMQLQNNSGTFQDSILSCGDAQHNCFRDVLKQYLSYTKECDSGSTSGICFPSQVYQMNNSLSDSSYHNNAAGLILNDGTLVDIYLDSASCIMPRGVYPNECGWVTIDVNGLKPPNIWGRDVYTFLFYKDRLRPLGSQGDAWDTCSAAFGYGCSAKYLLNN